MLKRFLKYMIVLSAAAAIAASVFLTAISVRSDMYAPVYGDCFEAGMTIQHIEGLDSGRSVVAGTLGENSYYKIYDDRGGLIAYHVIDGGDVCVRITDIGRWEHGPVLACLMQPADASVRSYGVLLFADQDGNTEKKTTLSAATAAGGYEAVFCLNGAEALYACTGNGEVRVFDAEGAVRCVLPTGAETEVTSVTQVDEKLIVSGRKTGAYAAGYDQQGGLVWEYHVFDHEKYDSAVLYGSQLGEHYFMYGQYRERPAAESGDTEISDAVSRPDDEALPMLPMPFRPLVRRDFDSRGAVNAFLVLLNGDGTQPRLLQYTTGTNHLLPVLCGVSDQAVFLYAAAAQSAEDAYFTGYLYELDTELRQKASEEFSVSSDSVLYCVQRNGIYAYTSVNGSGAYRMRYFSSAAVYAEEMRRVAQYTEIEDVYLQTTLLLPWLIVAAGGLVLLRMRYV